VDVTAPIAYNGLTTAVTRTPGTSRKSGIAINSINWPIPADFRVAKRALMDGATLSDIYLSGRTVSIEGEIFGQSAAELWDYLDTWMVAFSPRSPTLTDTTALTFVQPTTVTSTWASGSIPLYLTGKPIREPWHPNITPELSAPGDHSLLVYAQLLCPDPYKYVNESAIQQALTTAYAALSYRGDAPAQNGVELWFQLSGVGPVVDVTIAPAVAGIGTSDIRIDLSSATTGVKWVYSFANKTLTYAGVAIAAGYAGNIIGAITPGATAKYSIVSGSGGNLSYCKLVYPEAFF
jgi:hypothetical protein